MPYAGIHLEFLSSWGGGGGQMAFLVYWGEPNSYYVKATLKISKVHDCRNPCAYMPRLVNYFVVLQDPQLKILSIVIVTLRTSPYIVLIPNNGLSAANCTLYGLLHDLIIDGFKGKRIRHTCFSNMIQLRLIHLQIYLFPQPFPMPDQDCVYVRC